MAPQEARAVQEPLITAEQHPHSTQGGSLLVVLVLAPPQHFSTLLDFQDAVDRIACCRFLGAGCLVLIC